MPDWAESAETLVCEQDLLADAAPPPWQPPAEGLAVGACFVCFESGPCGRGRKGEPAWAGAAIVHRNRVRPVMRV